MTYIPIMDRIEDITVGGDIISKIVGLGKEYIRVIDKISRRMIDYYSSK
jgi:hypothetical protein